MIGRMARIVINGANIFVAVATWYRGSLRPEPIEVQIGSEIKLSASAAFPSCNPFARAHKLTEARRLKNFIGMTMM